MDTILKMGSRWRAPLLKRLQKSQKPMQAQDSIRIFTESPHVIGLQFRFTDSYGHASLTFDEARDLARLLIEAAHAPESPTDRMESASNGRKTPTKDPSTGRSEAIEQ